MCGAVASYNALLGGKLVAMLMTSAEARGAWRARYAGQPSIIGSQMAGRPVSRPADLRMLTTTSLYGVASSQYNRLVLRAMDFPELGRDVVWQKLKALTGGYGTVHLGPETVRALRELAVEKYQARRINHRFGEGTSARLRQVREGLEVLGIRSDDVLHHATPRLFYACELHDRAREALVGFGTDSVEYSPPLAAVADAWRRRWLAGRIQNPEVITQVAQFAPEQLALSLVGQDDAAQPRLALA